MPTTFANTIDGNEILAKRSKCDYAGNDIQTTYATKSELPTATSDLTNDSNFITSSDIPVKDVQVGGTSVVNAQGIAEISIPPTGVLDVEVDGSSVVNAQGVAEISMPTFTQVNADWDATSGVAEILNKPTIPVVPELKGLIAGTNITITESTNSITISAAGSAQVNSDWDATSGVAEILHKPDLSIYAESSDLATVATTGQYADLLDKPDIPASTSELVNDSDFITLSDVPAQVNADWDSNSGVSEILNKPDLSIYAESSDLATVATTGSYDDLVNKPSIPSAQVNADWDATSGVSEILNKPNLATVATTGDYSDLQNLPSIPAAQVNSDWSATSGVAQILNKPSNLVQDASYVHTDNNFTNAEKTKLSGIEAGAQVNTVTDVEVDGVSVVSQGVASITLPSVPVQDVTVNGTSVVSNGTAAVTVPAQVNADWNSSSGASEILNKPAIPSGTQLVPAATSADADKVLTVNAQGTPAWATAQAPISAGDGISITNNVVSTKVDGATIDTNASGELTVIGGGGTSYTAGNMIDISSDVISFSSQAGITDIVYTASLPNNPVNGTLYLIRENV